MATPEEEAVDGPAYDARTPEQVRYDVIQDQLRDASGLALSLAESVKELVASSKAAHVQTIYHETKGMGAWGAAAVAACFLTYLSMLLAFTILLWWLVPTMHDQEAWRNVFSRDMSAVQADVKQLKEKTK